MTDFKFKTLAITSGVASLIALSSLSVLAEGPIHSPMDKPFQSTLTRAEVHAEAVKKAIADVKDRVPSELTSSRLVRSSSVTRDEVLNGYFQALKEGSIALGDAPAAITAIAPRSALSRDAVLAETTEWLREQRGDTMMGGR